jgi:hypothetical protein
MEVSYDLIFGDLRSREPVDVLPRCAYSVRIFLDGDYSTGSIFYSSSQLCRCNSVCGGDDDARVNDDARFDGERSKRVGRWRCIEFMITRTGLGCGIGNSPQVDVAWLGFICSLVTKLGLKGTIPITLKAVRVVDLSNASRYAGAYTVRNSAFNTLCITFDSKLTMARCQHVFIFVKQTMSSKALEGMCAVWWIPK